jgi:hypothetical protein
MLKSIGRSSPGLKKIFGGTVSPPSLIRKTIYQVYFSSRLIKNIDRACQRGDGGRRGVRRSGNAQSALTFLPSNHSFIQAF